MSTRKYIRVYLKGMPTNHVGFTVENFWNLSKENFTQFIEHNLLSKTRALNMSTSRKEDVIPMKYLNEFLSRLHFTGVKKQRAIDYIKHRGSNFVIIFELMSKSKKSKEKKSMNWCCYYGPIFVDFTEKCDISSALNTLGLEWKTDNNIHHFVAPTEEKRN